MTDDAAQSAESLASPMSGDARSSGVSAFNPLVAGSIPARPTKFQRSIPVTSVTVYTESLDLEELKGGFEGFEVLKVTSAESPVHAQLGPRHTVSAGSTAFHGP